MDVLEGMCTQTHAVLFKALKDRMRPCLILNKIDRLALEMKLTPTEAFHHLRRIVENVNALSSSLLNSELRSRIERDAESNNSSNSSNDVNRDSKSNAAANAGDGEKECNEHVSMINNALDIFDILVCRIMYCGVFRFHIMFYIKLRCVMLYYTLLRHIIVCHIILMPYQITLVKYSFEVMLFYIMISYVTSFTI